ncbi:MAG: small ribosomal subunit biogenesis GTPase RsgA [Pseudomonadota bacterium]
MKQQNSAVLIAHYGATVDIETENGQIYRCTVRQNVGSLAVGDKVIWQLLHDGSGVITGYEPRRSTLTRPNRFGQHKLVAANVDRLAVVIAAQPQFATELLDQYLVAAELLGLDAIIVFNKIDLLSTRQLQDIQSSLSIYQQIGYEIVYTSMTTKAGLDQLAEILTKGTAIFVGQSGVGKSSLIDSLIPEAVVKTDDIAPHKSGRHVTSKSRLYHLPKDGNIIDSPGVREFGLWHISATELCRGFREFASYSHRCQFRNCCHQHEPHCAVRQAVERGDIAMQRYTNFKKLFTTLTHENYK